MIKRLLILADDELTGAFVQRTGKDMGFAVTSTSTFDEFRENFCASTPDEVVLEFQLDTAEVLRFLFSQRARARITLLSELDGQTLESARQLAESLGLRVGQALSKSVRTGALRAALEHTEPPAAAITTVDLSAGVANGELVLEYQPIVGCADGTLFDIEALVRWQSPSMGRVPPNAFIPIAETVPELMDRLTLAVAARAALDWPAVKLVGFSGRIAINLTAQNVLRPDLPGRLARVLLDAGLPPAHVKLEVPETVAMLDPLVTRDNLSRLRLKGFRLSIDDFGTGYSSLAMLRQLPFSELKIDGRFINDMYRSRDALAIVRTIVALAQTKKLATVAEGVEDEEMLPFLERLGIAYAQGYGIGGPFRLPQLVDWIASRQSRQRTTFAAQRP